VLFANAGVGHFGVNLGSIAAEEIDRIFNSNVKGTIMTVQRALPLMGPVPRSS